MKKYPYECLDGDHGMRYHIYGIIPADFAYDFAKIASFRNFLAHHYERVDYKEICQNTLAKLDDIKRYLEYIKQSCQIVLLR